MIWLVSFMMMRKVDDSLVDIRHGAGLVKADTNEEAASKQLVFMYRLYHVSDGWYSHRAVAVPLDQVIPMDDPIHATATEVT